MERKSFRILSNRPLTGDIREMRLGGDASAMTAPGQFVDVAIPGKYLRRPISVCDYTADTITLVYRIVGAGTAYMAGMKEGETLELLVGLGNGFDPSKAEGKALLAGGGVGLAPLYNLAKVLRSEGREVVVAACFNTAADVFYKSEFEALGVDFRVVTVDGSEGTKGFVTDLLASPEMPEGVGCWYTCGPKPMMKALSESASTPGQISMEERMGCGFGICMGCTIQTAKGPKRVCKDGPVFSKEDVIW